MTESSVGVVALVQARMSSSRLPGKVLLPCGKSTFLDQQLRRISSSQRIDKVVVLTSTDESDDKIVEFCTESNVSFFRGNLKDVFKRFYDFLTQQTQNFGYFARLTADCPFTCSDLIDETIKIATEGDYDYVSNTLFPTFPDGMDTEIIKISSFLKLNEFKLNDYEREHVTPGLYFRPKEFSLANLSTSPNHSQFRWTLDTERDAAFLSRISNENPDVVSDPRYFKIQNLILNRGETFPQTEHRKTISNGPWIEYPFHHA